SRARNRTRRTAPPGRYPASPLASTTAESLRSRDIVSRGTRPVPAVLGVIVAGRPRREGTRPRVGRLDVDDAEIVQQGFERLGPSFVIAVALAVGVVRLPAADRGDQPSLELSPREAVGFHERHGDAEQAALPGRVEHHLAVRARRRRGAGDRQVDRKVAQGAAPRATPTIASRGPTAPPSPPDMAG